MSKSIGFAGVIAFLLMTSVAGAITAIDITNPTGLSVQAPALGKFNLGYEFQVKTPMLVTSLGIYAGPTGEGLKVGSSYQVGIWSLASVVLPPVQGQPAFVAGDLLASATVTSASTLDGADNLFRYAPAQPGAGYTDTILQPGFYLAASEAVDNLYLFNAQSFIPSPDINLLSNCFSYSPPFSAPVYGPDSLITNGYWGPNFQYVTEPSSETVIPEPITLGGFVAALVGLCGYMRRRLAFVNCPQRGAFSEGYEPIA